MVTAFATPGIDSHQQEMQSLPITHAGNKQHFPLVQTERGPEAWLAGGAERERRKGPGKHRRAEGIPTFALRALVGPVAMAALVTLP